MVAVARFTRRSLRYAAVPLLTRPLRLSPLPLRGPPKADVSPAACAVPARQRTRHVDRPLGPQHGCGVLDHARRPRPWHRRHHRRLALRVARAGPWYHQTVLWTPCCNRRSSRPVPAKRAQWSRLCRRGACSGAQSAGVALVTLSDANREIQPCSLSSSVLFLPAPRAICKSGRPRVGAERVRYTRYTRYVIRSPSSWCRTRRSRCPARQPSRPSS